MTAFIGKLPLGTLNGGAQDDVELALARDVRQLEITQGQAAHTFSIPGFIAAVNQQHALVPKEKEAAFAENVERAYDYVAARTDMGISRAGYRSYQGAELVKGVGEALSQVGSAVKGVLPKPQLR